MNFLVKVLKAFGTALVIVIGAPVIIIYGICGVVISVIWRLVGLALWVILYPFLSKENRNALMYAIAGADD